MRDPIEHDVRQEPLLRYATRRYGQEVTCQSLAWSEMKGGAVAKALHRFDIALRGVDGSLYEMAVIRKVCSAAEVRMMQALQSVPGARAVPELIDAELAETGSWFVTPFYAGGVLTFADTIPQEVPITLARIHAHFAVEPVDWPFDHASDHLQEAIARAAQAMEASKRFRGDVSDHADLRRRIQSLARSAALIEASASLPKTLTHGDMHPGNIALDDRGSAVIIDWGNVCAAPAALDLANLIAPGSPAWTAYVGAYRAAGGDLDDTVFERSYHWGRAATGLMYLPYAVEHMPNALALVHQVLDAEQVLTQAKK